MKYRGRTATLIGASALACLLPTGCAPGGSLTTSEGGGSTRITTAPITDVTGLLGCRPRSNPYFKRASFEIQSGRIVATIELKPAATESTSATYVALKVDAATEGSLLVDVRLRSSRLQSVYVNGDTADPTASSFQLDASNLTMTLDATEPVEIASAASLVIEVAVTHRGHSSGC
jgi:hypothetical protein